MIERISFPFNLENIFVTIPLDISDIELKEDLDIDESKNFNTDIQTYLTFKREHKKFTIIKVNLNIARENNKEHLYNKNDLYLELNNIGYNNIIQINCIYNYYTFYLKLKTTNNFFFKTMFKPIKKIYKKQKTKY